MTKKIWQGWQHLRRILSTQEAKVLIILHLLPQTEVLESRIKPLCKVQSKIWDDIYNQAGFPNETRLEGA
jgi:hypothetical protein